MEKVSSARISVHTDRSSPTPLNSMADATPVTISGVTSGISRIQPASAPSRLRERTMPSASSTPSATAPSMATSATRRLNPTDSIRSASAKNASYQRRLNPVKTASDFCALNENSATTTIGRNWIAKNSVVIATSAFGARFMIVMTPPSGSAAGRAT